MLPIDVTPGRVVAFFTPVFTLGAGVAASAAAKWGLDVSAKELEAIFIGAATLATAPALLWLKGWQDYEKREGGGAAAVDNDMRIEEATAPRSATADAESDGVAAVAGAEVEDDDSFGQELLADGIDDEIDEFDDEALDALLSSGRE